MAEEDWKKWSEEFDRESRRQRTQMTREKDPEKKAALRAQLKRREQELMFMYQIRYQILYQILYQICIRFVSNLTCVQTVVGLMVLYKKSECQPQTALLPTSDLAHKGEQQD